MLFPAFAISQSVRFGSEKGTGNLGRLTGRRHKAVPGYSGAPGTGQARAGVLQAEEQKIGGHDGCTTLTGKSGTVRKSSAWPPGRGLDLSNSECLTDFLREIEL